MSSTSDLLISNRPLRLTLPFWFPSHRAPDSRRHTPDLQDGQDPYPRLSASKKELRPLAIGAY